jgi:hypothetical protein
MKMSVLISAVLTAGLFAGGCNKSSQTASNDHGPGGHSHDKKSGPPHGGTPVKVGGHDFHLELVNDTHAGRMLAYVFDDHLEHAESVPPTTFELVAKIGATEHRTTFNPGDGSRPAVRDVDVFHAAADWLKTATNFEGVIPTITLKNETFTNVTFSFPKGSSHTSDSH